MTRIPCALASVVLLGGLASAQIELRSRLVPITAPARHAGTYHVATGTWTRGSNLGFPLGPVIYNNTCPTNYFVPMLSTEKFQHRSRIPSPSAPRTDSVFYGSTNTAHRYDEHDGCNGSYEVYSFEIQYCSSHIGTVDWQYEFANSYTACASTDLVPDFTIAVTGLPGGTSTGDQACWIVEIEPVGYPHLIADGDGYYDGPSTVDQFGWSFQPTSPTTLADATGPVVAGNYDGFAGTPCTGTDGTIWDSAGYFPWGGPTPETEALGTGMSSNDFFRVTGGPVSFPSGPDCYSFGTLHSDFHLKIESFYPCGKDPIVWPFCGGGVAGIVTCPCGNPQVPAGSMRGCNNFVNGGTGGARLLGWGGAVISLDTLVFVVTDEAPSVTLSVLFQGTTNSANARSGAGVRCVGGTLKRLYKGNSSAGSIRFPNNGLSVHERSAAAGFPIVAPITLYYYCAYRNSAANGQPGCPGFTFGFNTTNAGFVSWSP